MRYIGLDVHLHFIEVCCIDEKGSILWRHKITPVTRESLVAFARSKLQPDDRLALEATGNCWAVLRVLRPFVAAVVVSNPLLTKAIASAKVKTDKVDAAVLAQLLRLDYLPAVWEPDEQTQRLRSWCVRRSKLVGERTRLGNRIHAVLAERLLACPAGDLWSQAGRQWLASVEIDEESRWLIDSELRRLAVLVQEIAAIEHQLAILGHADQRVRLLMTMPGVSLVVAVALVAAIGDVSRFRDGDALASYFGLVPSTRQSGNRCYHGPITKRGRSQPRWMLVEAAHHLATHPGPLGHFFRRLAGRKCHNVAVVATARKLAVLACRLLTTGQPYRYALPQSTEDKLRKLRIAATGQRRKGGSPKGSKPVARLGAGVPSRRCRSLDEVYQSEGIASRQPAPPGEQKTIEHTQSADFVAELAVPKVIARRPGKATDRPAQRTAATPAAVSPADASQQAGPPAVRQAAHRGKG